MKFSGLDVLQKKTEQLSKFAQEIDGELAVVEFDASDPSSIESAIQKINDTIDEKAKSYERNEWIKNLVEQLKEHARKNVLEKAATVRAES